jgi:hypothetical protein
MSIQKLINKADLEIKAFEFNKAKELEAKVNTLNTLVAVGQELPNVMEYTPHAYPAQIGLTLPPMTLVEGKAHLNGLGLLEVVREKKGTMIYRPEVGAELAHSEAIMPVFMEVRHDFRTGGICAELRAFKVVAGKIARLSVPVTDIQKHIERTVYRANHNREDAPIIDTKYKFLGDFRERQFGTYNTWAGGGGEYPHDATFWSLDARLVKGQRTSLFDKSFAVVAYFFDNEYGTAQANKFMTKNPGAAVLKVEDGVIYLAHKDDKGV